MSQINIFEWEEHAMFAIVLMLSIINQVLIDARNKLGIPWEDSSRQSQADYIMTFDRYQFMQPDTFVEYVPHIRELWKDSGIRAAFDRRREFQLVKQNIIITHEP